MRKSWLPPLRAALVLGALALPLAGCLDEGSSPLTPEASVRLDRAAVTDAELSAVQAGAYGTGARIW